MGSWISDGQVLAATAISAALQRLNDLETVGLLEAVPVEAWGAGNEFAIDVEHICIAIRSGVGDAISGLAESYSTDSDPLALGSYCEDLTKLWRAFHASTRTLPREKVPKPQGEAPVSALPQFANLRLTWNLAKKEVPMLFRDAIPLAELSMIVSEPGTGKTTFAIGLGLSVALGKTMLSGFEPKQRGRVALLLAEDGAIPSSQRIRAWCEAHEVTQEDFENAASDGWISAIFGDSAQLLDFSNGACRRTLAYDELSKKCKAERYDMLVVDSLIEWAGCPEENSNSMMQQAAKCLIDLARVSGGAVVALHHTNKTSDRNGAVGLHAIRGGSSLAGKVRWAAVLSHLQDDEAKRFRVPESDRRRYLRMDIVKSQYSARPGECMHFERGLGGVLEAVKLLAPSAEDSLLSLARVLADTLSDNEAKIPKWDLLQKKPGAGFRAQLKVHHGKNATIRNIGLAYDLAFNCGWIVEEEIATGHGCPAKIPRVARSDGKSVVLPFAKE